MKKKQISKIIIEDIEKVVALSNKIRLKIVLAIFNTEVLGIGNSLKKNEINKLIKIERHALKYHLDILKDTGMIKKRKYKDGFYFQTTPRCIETLKMLGINNQGVKHLSKELKLNIK
ncbi:MAG: helix-turn-helix domain-containing protein [Candidatus Woesearchaeota archaeon]